MGLWKHLHRGCYSFLRFTRCDGGDGSKICFWHGFQNGETTVKERDSNLFQLQGTEMLQWWNIESPKLADFIEIL